ncbi:hypothetical protein OQA88_6008 [Cercophora sp. LCS_1]
MFRPLITRSLPRATRTVSTASRSSLPVNITGSGTGTIQKVAIPGKPYTFTADTYTVLGGLDSAPSPVSYSLASLSTCNQVTGSLVAKDLGIKLGEWKVDVEGILPTDVLVQGKEGNANWEKVTLVAKVQTDADEAGFQKFVDEVERRCPITQLFQRSGVEWVSKWENVKL